MSIAADWMLIPDVAHCLRVSSQTVRRWVTGRHLEVRDDRVSLEAAGAYQRQLKASRSPLTHLTRKYG